MKNKYSVINQGPEGPDETVSAISSGFLTKALEDTGKLRQSLEDEHRVLLKPCLACTSYTTHRSLAPRARRCDVLNYRWSQLKVHRGKGGLGKKKNHAHDKEEKIIKNLAAYFNSGDLVI